MADQNEENKNNIDLDKILLPNKEVHTPASAERVNAGVLLAQEQEAAKVGPKDGGSSTVTGNGLGAPPQRGSEDLGGGSTTPAPAPKPKKEEAFVKPIETYQGDVESLVQEKNVSVVSIAAAEAKKREEAPIAQPVAQEHWILKRVSLVIGGVLLIAIAGGALAYTLTRPTTVPVTPLSTSAPFINVDDTKQVSINPTAPSASIMDALNSARASVNLSLGLIERLYVTEGSDNSAKEVPIKTLLGALAPQAPQALLRTLTGQYLLGVHSFDENQAFLILQTDSYETAYAAMLEWEPTMSHDLLPLFARTPPVHVQNNPTLIATTTATSSTQNASTTPKDYFAASTTTLPTPTIADSGLPTTFSDRVVENHDARVLQTKDGDILLMWTFLDRNTLVIATNEFTLRELITRITNAPTINLPQ